MVLAHRDDFASPSDLFHLHGCILLRDLSYVFGQDAFELSDFFGHLADLSHTPPPLLLVWQIRQVRGRRRGCRMCR
jgi:hypothetical protein